MLTGGDGDRREALAGDLRAALREIRPFLTANTFSAWLVRQHDRDDRVGDLARDVAFDANWPTWARGYPQLHSHLLGCGASDGAHAALRSAYVEYLSDPARRRQHAKGLRVLLGLAERLARARRPRSVSASLRGRVFERDGFRCRRCGATPPEARLVIDHVMPVALGGTGDDWNLQTLCEPCNQGKGDRPPHPHDLRLLP